ncbi:hypothetical protein FKM82_024769 [Ascaphus truei]
MRRSCNEPYPTEEWPFQSNKEEDISYGEPEPSHTHKTPKEWWGCLNSVHAEKTALYDDKCDRQEQQITEYIRQLIPSQEKHGGSSEAAKISNKDGDPSIPDGTESSKTKRRKKKNGSSLAIEGIDMAPDPVGKKGVRDALQPRENGGFVTRMTENPEGPRQKSCNQKKCLAGANREEPSTNHTREAELEPMSDNPLTYPEDALKIARCDCDLLREQLKLEREDNAELQKTVLAMYSESGTELENLKDRSRYSKCYYYHHGWKAESI